MNVVLVMPYTNSPAWGVENVAYNIVSGLKKIEGELERRDIFIKIVSNKGNSLHPKNERLSPRIEVVYYKQIPPATFLGDLQSAFMSSTYLRNLITGADVVHSHNVFFSFQFSKLFGDIPLIHHFHSVVRDIVPFINSTYQRFSYHTIDYRLRLLSKTSRTKYVAISKLEKVDINRFFGIPLEDISIIHNPIYDHFFRVDKNEDEGSIFYPARLIPKKNHIALIKAVKLLKSSGISNFRLVLTGTPEDMKYYEEIVSLINKFNLQKNVIFSGAVPIDVLLHLYSKASIVVVPSFRETFSLIVIEAMATGTPVVASPAGIVPEAVVSGKNGYIIDPRDPKDIAEKLRILLEDTKKRRVMGKNAKKTVERWKSENIAKEIVDVWYKYI